MIVRQRGFAGLGFGDRDTMPLGEGCEPPLGFRIKDPATCYDQWLPGAAQQAGGLGEFRRIRGGAAEPAQPLGEEVFGVVVGFGLHVLAERECHGTALGWVGQHRKRAL